MTSETPDTNSGLSRFSYDQQQDTPTHKRRSKLRNEFATSTRNNSNIDSSPELSPVSSPPNSPSLLPRINEKDDDYALSSDSEAWSLSSVGQPGRRSPSVPQDDMESFTISSDSYFSQHRESFGELRGRRLESALLLSNSGQKKNRRTSDLSMKSSDYTESDSELPKTPSRASRRRSTTPQKRAATRSKSRTGDADTSSSGNGGPGSVDTTSTEISQTAKIFKNLLILEESLRQQNAEQQQLRMKYMSFLMCLAVVSILTGYRWMASAVDDSTFVRFITQIAFIISFLTLVLFYLSGEYNRTIARPRKFLTITNKGLRQLNIRLVKIKTKTWDLVIDSLKKVFLVPIKTMKLQTQYALKVVNLMALVKFKEWCIDLEIKLRTSRQSGGVRDVKIVLNPRIFNTATRERWELYRNEFWNKETIRRRTVLQREQEKENK